MVSCHMAYYVCRAGRQKDAHVRAEPLLQMAPPHLCIINANKRAGRAHTTCVSFGSKGDKVCVYIL